VFLISFNPLMAVVTLSTGHAIRLENRPLQARSHLRSIEFHVRGVFEK
jgi:hypothetical protein